MSERSEDLMFLGKNLGLIGGWDANHLAAIQYYDVQMNELGLRFAPAVQTGDTLFVDFESGEVRRYPSDDEECIGELVKVDWSVFND